MVLLFISPTDATTFCAIADIPYDYLQASILKDQIQTGIPEECSFLLHLGGLRQNNGQDCTLEQFQAVAEILKLSPVPVFVLLGDNDWNDCANPIQGLQYFDETFLNFDTKYWNHSLPVTRQPSQPYNFAIALNQSLIMGLRLVNGPFPNEAEEKARLQDQFNWTEVVIQDYVDDQAVLGRVGRIVVTGHAEPGYRLNEDFFLPLRNLIESYLANATPVLFMNGALHVWTYEPDFYGQPSFLHVVLAGEAIEPPTLVHINNDGLPATTDVAFTFDRQLTATDKLRTTLRDRPRATTITTKFCAIADIPYDAEQAIILRDQLKYDIPDACPFLIHLGDMRENNGKNCTLEHLQGVAEILKLSPKPVFIHLGDNDWNDCANPDEALKYYDETFLNFDTKYWNHSLPVTRQPSQPYNFAIELDQTLILGLRVINGPFPDEVVEKARLQDQFNWTEMLIQDYVDNQAVLGRVGRIVVTGHAEPGYRLNEDFFLPLRNFISSYLDNATPVLFMNGDVHKWTYEPDFYGQPSFLHVILAGEALEPPTIVSINNDGLPATTDVAFMFDRQLPPCHLPASFLPLFEGVTVHRYQRAPDKLCIQKCALHGATPGGAEPWYVGKCPTGVFSWVQ
jgi:hypothetical protein